MAHGAACRSLIGGARYAEIIPRLPPVSHREERRMRSEGSRSNGPRRMTQQGSDQSTVMSVSVVNWSVHDVAHGSGNR